MSECQSAKWPEAGPKTKGDGRRRKDEKFFTHPSSCIFHPSLKYIFWFLYSGFWFLFLAGCATITGPGVSRQEIEKSTQELKVKALAFQIQQLQRLNDVGHKIISAVGEDDAGGQPQPFLGVVCAQVDEYLRPVYDLDVSRGVVIVVVKKHSPADSYGLMPGDIVSAVGGVKVQDIRHFNRLVEKFKIGDFMDIELLRGAQSMTKRVEVGKISVNIPIILVDRQEVNAATDGQTIFVTYGLLHFTKSDEELAAVLAHELAHAVRGHVIKMQGGQIVTSILALILGGVAESGSSGSGEVIMRGVEQLGRVFGAQYSRDLEREADYFSVRFVYRAGFNPDICATLHERFAVEIPGSLVYNYLSTHPSTPERILRIRKIIEELAAPPEPVNKE